MRGVGEASEDEVQAVTDWLTRNGFTESAHELSPHFGNEVTEWARGDMLVRSVRDRGQWFVDVARRGWDDWFDADLVAHVLDSKSPDLVDRVAQAVASGSNLDRLRPVLVSVRAETARRSLKQGFPPRHPHDG